MFMVIQHWFYVHGGDYNRTYLLSRACYQQPNQTTIKALWGPALLVLRWSINCGGRRSLLVNGKVWITVRGTLTESIVVSIFPFGRSLAKVVSLKLILTWFAADDVAAPRWGLVASSSTFNDAIACSCVAFSSTLPGTGSFIMLLRNVSIRFANYVLNFGNNFDINE